MDKKKLSDYEEKLLREKERIIKEKKIVEEVVERTDKESTGELSTFRTHIADLSSDTYQKEIASQLTTQERKILFEIEEALRRIKEGKYGICERCGAEIAEERLAALPYCRYCIKCQKEIEGKG
jgi:RNA polymerase-binding protein DksA|uniref:TraR/DksA family transcriptional regulator n=1 Tax=candidate division WOR-3 bacterium TaxID=2052148 RepID=A0A7C3Z417_UNCW3